METTNKTGRAKNDNQRQFAIRRTSNGSTERGLFSFGAFRVRQATSPWRKWLDELMGSLRFALGIENVKCTQIELSNCSISSVDFCRVELHVKSENCARPWFNSVSYGSWMNCWITYWPTDWTTKNWKEKEQSCFVEFNMGVVAAATSIFFLLTIRRNENYYVWFQFLK